eukprot:4742397-Amphidinium_carterae.1
MVTAEHHWDVETVLDVCRRKLNLDSVFPTMELWHGQDRVPDTRVRGWPGLKPEGEITEYQLVLTRVLWGAQPAEPQ